MAATPTILPAGYNPFKPGYKQFSCPVFKCQGHLCAEVVGDRARVCCTDLACGWFVHVSRGPAGILAVYLDTVIEQVRTSDQAQRNTKIWKRRLSGPNPPNAKTPLVDPFKETRAMPPKSPLCKVVNCGNNKLIALGLCSRCYTRWRLQVKGGTGLTMSQFIAVERPLLDGRKALAPELAPPDPDEVVVAEQAPRIGIAPPATSLDGKPLEHPITMQAQTSAGRVYLVIVADMLWFYNQAGQAIGRLNLASTLAGILAETLT